MSDSNSSSGGVSVVGLLGVLFVTLKLTGVIDWSWWWVTLPFWGGIALALTILFGGAVIAVIGISVVSLIERIQERKRAKVRESIQKRQLNG